MKLTLKIKLLPTDEQANLLLDTMKEANTVCNAISDVAWKKKIFNDKDQLSRYSIGVGFFVKKPALTIG